MWNDVFIWKGKFMWFYVLREVSNIKVKIKTCFASDFEIVKSIIDIFKTTPKMLLIIQSQL